LRDWRRRQIATSDEEALSARHFAFPPFAILAGKLNPCLRSDDSWLNQWGALKASEAAGRRYAGRRIGGEHTRDCAIHR
jgi:hypothetical protein